MPYSEEALEAMQYDPVAMRGYYWRVAMQVRRSPILSGLMLENMDKIVASSLSRPRLCAACAFITASEQK
jgi:hypothetical protein